MCPLHEAKSTHTHTRKYTENNKFLLNLFCCDGRTILAKNSHRLKTIFIHGFSIFFLALQDLGRTSYIILPPTLYGGQS